LTYKVDGVAVLAFGGASDHPPLRKESPMELSEIHKEVPAIAFACAGSGNGLVPIEDVVPECDELVDNGWLRTEEKENGDVAYFWTVQAETALDLRNLTTVEGPDLN
jgi:hypothetical protein